MNADEWAWWSTSGQQSWTEKKCLLMQAEDNCAGSPLPCPPHHCIQAVVLEVKLIDHRVDHKCVLERLGPRPAQLTVPHVGMNRLQLLDHLRGGGGEGVNQLFLSALAPALPS